jgi:hypothetical protein
MRISTSREKYLATTVGVLTGLTGLLLVQLLCSPRSMASAGSEPADSIKAARRALYKSIENEKSNPGDESASAVNAALESFKAQVTERESEILSRLKAIQLQDVSIPPYADDVLSKAVEIDLASQSKEAIKEYRSLRAELEALQSQLATAIAAVNALRSKEGRESGEIELRPADLFVVTQSEGSTSLCTSTPINAVLGQGSPSLPSTSGQQAGRIFRNGIAFASKCNSPGSCSLFTSTGLRLFDAYTLTNNSGASACVTITFSKPSTCNNSAEGIFAVAYLNGFNPAAPCQNRVGDPGVSVNFGSVAYSFGVPNGSSFTLVFHEVDPGTQAGCPYSFTIQASPSCSCVLNCLPNLFAPPDLSKCGTGAVVNYPVFTTGICSSSPPTCSPPSGSFLPVGTTVVNCSSSFGASCSFNVTVTSFCLQDETNPTNSVTINPNTGDYSFFCNGVQVASGRGKLITRGCIGTIEDIKGDRRIYIEWDLTAGGKGAGTAIAQVGPNNTRCQITDKNMSNNPCLVPPPIMSPSGKGGMGRSQD